MSTYRVVNPFFARLGIGPMTDADIEVLEDYYSGTFESPDGAFMQMSDASQQDFADIKAECEALVVDAKMDRETTTYNSAEQCITDARTQMLAIAAAQAAPENGCPAGFIEVEDT